jgi:glycosyltransferase involved in cell wall biosynthesis
MMFADRQASYEELNLVYNSLDVNTNTGGGEGWGLTSFESAACKIAQIVPDWSATGEIWEGTGMMIKVVEVRHELSSINTMQAVISTEHFAELLQELYEDSAKKDAIAEACYDVTRRPEYTWEAVGRQFDTLFKNSINRLPASGKIGITAEGVLELKKLQQQQQRPVFQLG